MAIETTNPLVLRNIRKHLVVTPVFRQQSTSAIAVRGKTGDDIDIRLSQGASVVKTFVVERTNYGGAVNITIAVPAPNLNLGISTTTQTITLPATTQATQEFSITVRASQNAAVTSTLSPAVAQQSVILVTGAATGVPASEARASVIVNQTIPNNRLTVTIASNRINQRETTTATAVIRNAINDVLTLPVTWSVANQSIAKVTSITDNSNRVVQTSDRNIVITGIAVGRTQIIADVDDLRSTVEIEVTQAPGSNTITVSINKNNVTPATPDVRATAQVISPNGSVVPNQTIAWASSNAVVASIDQSGNIVPLTVGATTITATSGSISGTSTFTVVPGGGGEDTGGVTFDKNLNNDLVFNWTRGNTTPPPPITVTARNSATTKTFRVALTPANTAISIIPSTFDLSPGASRAFTITTPLTLLTQLPINQTVVNLTVSITQQP